MTTNTKRIAGIGIFAAIVVVLQILATLVPFYPFAITLVLVPVVIGAALYGVAAGGILGAVFGLVVLVMSISGQDIGGQMLWVANPLAAATVIMLRGIFAGMAAGAVYRVFAKRNMLLGVVLAAIICPVVNTGLFLLAMYFIFPYFLDMWAGGATTVYFLFIGLAGINFVIELMINLILSPAIVRILSATKSAHV